MDSSAFLTVSFTATSCSSSRSSFRSGTSTMFDGTTNNNDATQHGDKQQCSKQKDTMTIKIADNNKPGCPESIESQTLQSEQTIQHQNDNKRLQDVATVCWSWIQKQSSNNDNRYALQVGIAFLVASMAVIVEPISNLAPNAFWVGVSVVTVLDNTIGGFLALSIQRMIGTIIGGGLSIVVMTITRAIFPVWSWKAIVLLCFLMFFQVFLIAKIKLRPNMNYAGGILIYVAYILKGLLTTVIILLSGYPDLIHDHLSGSAKLGFWRVMDLVIGIIIAMWASLCIFPLRARHTMRKNLGASLEEAADLYERTTSYCFNLQNTRHHQNDLSAHLALTEEEDHIKKETKSGAKATLEERISQDMEIWNHELVNDLCNSAYQILSKLQTEATRLQSVSKEYYLRIPVDLLLCRGRERIKQDLLRTKRYANAIEAMKRIVWPLVSFRLLLPLIKLNSTVPSDRTAPTLRIIENFQDSLWVMRQLATILKDTSRTLSEDPDFWAMIQHRVMLGAQHAQHELAQTILIGTHSNCSVDSLKLLSCYGFLVRCCTIWQGLENIVNELGPQQLHCNANENNSFSSNPDVTIHLEAVGNRPASD